MWVILFHNDIGNFMSWDFLAHMYFKVETCYLLIGCDAQNDKCCPTLLLCESFVFCVFEYVTWLLVWVFVDDNVFGFTKCLLMNVT